MCTKTECTENYMYQAHGVAIQCSTDNKETCEIICVMSLFHRLVKLNTNTKVIGLT